MYVVSLVSRLPMQIVEETVTYGWPQGTSPYLVVPNYSKRPPCLNFAVYTGYMLPRRLDALLLPPGSSAVVRRLRFAELCTLEQPIAMTHFDGCRNDPCNCYEYN